MTKTMAEVLAEHQLDFVAYLITEQVYHCICGKRSDNHEEHQAAALTAAGYGLVADVEREAWDEGFKEGGDWAQMQRVWFDDPPTKPINPHRSAT